ncbi:hypothetical protein Bbelb_029330 [Branchiostoma belcheri]|nr:hypothetical protein Bbelb_029330 [Branchiostoma belcheri]
MSTCSDQCQLGRRECAFGALSALWPISGHREITARDAVRWNGAHPEIDLEGNADHTRGTASIDGIGKALKQWEKAFPSYFVGTRSSHGRGESAMRANNIPNKNLDSKHGDLGDLSAMSTCSDQCQLGRRECAFGALSALYLANFRSQRDHGESTVKWNGAHPEIDLEGNADHTRGTASIDGIGKALKQWEKAFPSYFVGIATVEYNSQREKERKAPSWRDENAPVLTAQGSVAAANEFGFEV